MAYESKYQGKQVDDILDESRKKILISFDAPSRQFSTLKELFTGVSNLNEFTNFECSNSDFTTFASVLMHFNNDSEQVGTIDIHIKGASSYPIMATLYITNLSSSGPTVNIVSVDDNKIDSVKFDVSTNGAVSALVGSTLNPSEMGGSICLIDTNEIFYPIRNSNVVIRDKTSPWYEYILGCFNSNNYKGLFAFTYFDKLTTSDQVLIPVTIEFDPESKPLESDSNFKLTFNVNTKTSDGPKGDYTIQGSINNEQLVFGNPELVSSLDTRVFNLKHQLTENLGTTTISEYIENYADFVRFLNNTIDKPQPLVLNYADSTFVQSFSSISVQYQLGSKITFIASFVDYINQKRVVVQIMANNGDGFRANDTVSSVIIDIA